MDEFIEKLKERYEKGEISKKAYEDILGRYMKENKVKENEVKSTGSSPRGEGDMEKRNGRDYKCAGSCTLPSGKYGYISVAGALNIKGDISAEKISVSGSLHAAGDIKVNSFKGAGSIKIDGNLHGDEISIGGSLRVRDIKGDIIKIGGTIHTEKIRGDTVHIGGSVKASLLEGDEIYIKVGGKSVLEVIDGDTVEVSGKKGLLRKCSGTLVVNEIHGDRVRVECTTAKLVDCNDAVIGYGCEIETLKAERMKISKNAKVVQKVRK